MVKIKTKRDNEKELGLKVQIPFLYMGKKNINYKDGLKNDEYIVNNRIYI